MTWRLRAAGHEVFLPQDQEHGKDAAGIFKTDVGGIDWADALVAIMDGSDPDSGTAWECGYAYGKKPVVVVRTDFRGAGDPRYPYLPTGPRVRGHGHHRGGHSRRAGAPRNHLSRAGPRAGLAIERRRDAQTNGYLAGGCGQVA
jgi:hypothetical protein